MRGSQDTKYKLKFFDRILEIFMPSSTQLLTIPHHGPFNKEPDSPAEISGLAAMFGRAYVSRPSTQNSSPVFVGGFNLAEDPWISPPIDSPPYAMPEPQLSLTMTHALRLMNDQSVAAPSPPVTPQGSTRRRAQSRSNAPADPPSPGKVSSLSVTPVKPSISAGSARSRASSPSHQPGLVQCSGFTKANKRCARMVKNNDLIGGTFLEPIERFCYQHTEAILKPSGYYLGQTSVWVKFDEWIRPYLQESTQAALRAEMLKAKSPQDEPGYIYTFEIRDPGSKTIRLKVGRAANVVKRLDQWAKQCGSEEQVPRGVYPENREQDGRGLMKGRIQAGEKAPFCHRLERLIHIELADLVSSRVYLEPGWPNIETPPSMLASPKKKTSGKGNTCIKECPDCGARHQEIFEFQRWEGKYKGQEWERIVKPIIEHWGNFVKLHV